jgi:hypothetical protein
MIVDPLFDITDDLFDIELVHPRPEFPHRFHDDV